MISVSAAEDAQRAQRHDERRDPQPRGQDAVGQPADQAGQRCRPATPTGIDESLLHRHGAQQAAHGQNRADGKIDAAGDDDHGHAQRHDVDHRRLPDHAREIRVGQKMRRRDRQRDEQNDQAEKRQQPLQYDRPLCGSRWRCAISADHSAPRRRFRAPRSA